MERIELYEEWRDIQGFENYQVSNFGNVRSKQRIIIQKGHKNYFKRVMKSKVLISRKQNSGYLVVWLSVDGVVTPHTVHRLVANAFVEKISGKDFVNHIDGDKTNNNASNLEWVTKSENLEHDYRVLGHRHNSRSIVCVETGERFPSIREAGRKMNINPICIGHVLSGRNKRAGGYTWKG
ncbi:MAG: NUMOD4 motif-containing HNH endonuclease [Bacteroidaceae bacterium]|nr:NUMOD4 motif-containing HNH endonuclease [Bacteroidaceae bacterium]